MSYSKKNVSVSLNQVRTLTSSDQGMVIHRQKIAQCCIVGNVLAVNEQSTKTTYTVTDYTGPAIEVSYWKKSQDGEGRAQRSTDQTIIFEQCYIKAFGQPRKDANGEVHFVAFHIQRLENLNELTVHLLEVVRDSKELALLKNNYIFKSQSGDGLNSIEGGKNLAGLSKTNVPQISGFNQVQNVVMNLIKANTSDIGISLNEITQSIRSSKPEVIKEAIDFLLNEGHIYEALDEVHFKSSI